MIPWLYITSFGGITVMAPAAAAIMAWLAVGRAWRMALWWGCLFSVGMLLVVLSKVAFIGWGLGIQALDFTGFSGHAMRATAVLPVLFFVLLQRATRAAGIVLGLALGVLIGISRLVLHAHSASEAASGCALGALVSVGYIQTFDLSEKFHFNRWVLALSLTGLLTAPYAEPAPTQSWMITLSLYLSGHDRPYVREGWGMAPANWHGQNGKPRKPRKRSKCKILLFSTILFLQDARRYSFPEFT